MSNIDMFSKILNEDIKIEEDFFPKDVVLTNFLIEEEQETIEETIPVHIVTKPEFIKLKVLYPDEQVIAVDATELLLGKLKEGIIGAIRASIVIKPRGISTEWKIERYGPYLIKSTLQNKDSLYKRLYHVVYGKDPASVPPDPFEILDKARLLLERLLQKYITEKYTDSIILWDGSLIGGTIDTPSSFLKETLKIANSKRNSIVGVSKYTRLTLADSKRSILSLLEGIEGPCYVKGIKDVMLQKKRRYFGEIYVAKLKPLSEAFRIDIQPDTLISHEEILGKLAGISGEQGYPEELRIAHMTCILTSVEALSLQALAASLYELRLRDELKRKLFPF